MQRYFAINRENNNFLLDTSDWHHIFTVMRMSDGDLVEVVWDNVCYLGKIDKNGNHPIVLEHSVFAHTIDTLPVTLIVPLLKEQKMDYILQKATELGVYRIIPVIMERSIVKLDAKDFEKKRERWKRICKEASEQSKRVSIPIIADLRKVKQLTDLDGLKLVCSTQESVNTIKNELKNNKNYVNISIVLGPEGGLSQNEEKELMEIGFIPVSLGTRILRAETVPLFVLSCINYEKME